MQIKSIPNKAKIDKDRATASIEKNLVHNHKFFLEVQNKTWKRNKHMYTNAQAYNILYDQFFCVQFIYLEIKCNSQINALNVKFHDPQNYKENQKQHYNKKYLDTNKVRK